MVWSRISARVGTNIRVTFLLKSQPNCRVSSYWMAALLFLTLYLFTNRALTRSNPIDPLGQTGLHQYSSSFKADKNASNQRLVGQAQRNGDLSSNSDSILASQSSDWQLSSQILSNPGLERVQRRPEDSAARGLTSHSDPDALSEGSGSGPIPVVRHKSEKFDDTEDEDDDTDDDDYDYKESPDVGSGHGNLASEASKKSDSMVIQGSRPLNKPSRDEGDIYLPYRPPTTVATNISTSQASTQAPMLSNQMTTVSNTRLSTLGVPNTNSSDRIMDIVPGKPSSSPAFDNNQSMTESFLPSKPKLPNPSDTTPVRADQTLPATTQMPKQFVQTTTSKQPTEFFDNRHNTTMKVPNKDYDYEGDDDDDDDDSEETSNFEDNEPLDSILPNTTTSQPAVSSSGLNRVVDNLTSVEYGRVVPAKGDRTSMITSKPAVPATTANPFSDVMTPTTKIPSRTRVPPTASSTTTRLPLDSAGEEDDSFEDDEEYEETENEMDDGEDEEDSHDVFTSSTQIPTYTSIQPTRWTTFKPTPSPISFDTDYNRYKPSRIPTPTTSNPIPSQRAHSTSQPTVAMTVATYTTPAVKFTTTTISQLSRIASSTTTAPKIPWRPDIAQTSMKPTTTPIPPIRQPTGPRTRVTPLNVLAFDKNLQDDDANLTRQIYDKAVEIYRATSQAVTSTIDAIWPPSFEINATTFEPLLAQPFLFMLALGAAIVGLVLTMMLVVYIIAYQIQPKDDISLY